MHKTYALRSTPTSRARLPVLVSAALALAVACDDKPPSGGATTSAASASAPSTATASAPATASTAAPVAPDQVAALVLGGDHSFALYGDGTVRGWGNNDDSALGFPKKKQRVVKSTAVPSLKYVKQLSTTDGHTCSVHADGLARCWGRNTGGALGDGSFQSRAFPTPVVELKGVVEVQVGGTHTCARLAKGGVHCWGRVVSGQRRKPVPVPKLASVAGLALGGERSCAWHTDGKGSCWDLVVGLRYDVKSVMEDGDGNIKKEPQPIKGLKDAEQIAVATTHACLLHKGGKVSCWGFGERGQLGDGGEGHSHSSLEPKPVAELKGVKHVALGHAFSCALLGDGTVQCWGDNAWGQLGQGDKKRRTTPTPVPELTDVRLLGAGRGHVCVVKRDGAQLCWGKNMDGQAGDGTAGMYASRKVPTPVKMAE